jgi:hypothetical protein
MFIAEFKVTRVVVGLFARQRIEHPDDLMNILFQINNKRVCYHLNQIVRHFCIDRTLKQHWLRNVRHDAANDFLQKTALNFRFIIQTNCIDQHQIRMRSHTAHSQRATFLLVVAHRQRKRRQIVKRDEYQIQKRRLSSALKFTAMENHERNNAKKKKNKKKTDLYCGGDNANRLVQ